MSTVIAAGTFVEGGLRGKVDLRVEGQVAGPVTGEAAIYLAAGAEVSGDVRGREVTIGCVLRHDVHATHAVHLLATAEVYGQIVAPRITVDDGAMIEGTVKITRAATPSQTASERRGTESRMRQIAAAAIAVPAVVSASAPREIPQLPALGRRTATRRRA